MSKLDRLGRDAKDVGTTIKALASRKIETIVRQLGKLDLVSPSGKLMLDTLAAVAEMERDLLVERTQAGLAKAKAAGRVLRRPSKTSAEQGTVIATYDAAGVSVSELARRFSLSRANILGIVKPACSIKF